MARKIDEEKIRRIKEATMQTIVENGIESTTIAMIAKNAKVSGGYLYRTYSGKQELINELYSDKVASLYDEFETLINLHPKSVKAIIETFVQNRINYNLNTPIASKFYYQLLHNNNFLMNNDIKSKTNNLMKTFKMIGLESGEISDSISLYQLQYHIFVYVVDYINFKMKNIFGKQEISKSDVNILTENILKILK